MEKILLISRDEQEGNTIANILQDAGYDTIVTNYLKDLALILEHNDFTIVVHNALISAEIRFYINYLRRRPKTENSLLVVLYPSGTDLLAVTPISFGSSKLYVDAYIEKPFHNQELMPTIKQLLRDR